MSSECSCDYNYIDIIEDRVATIEAGARNAVERVAEIEGRIDEVANTCVRHWDFVAQLDELKCENADFKRQLISELVKAVVNTFKQEYCIDFEPADEQEFLQNLQYLYT